MRMNEGPPSSPLHLRLKYPISPSLSRHHQDPSAGGVLPGGAVVTRPTERNKRNFTVLLAMEKGLLDISVVGRLPDPVQLIDDILVVVSW